MSARGDTSHVKSPSNNRYDRVKPICWNEGGGGGGGRSYPSPLNPPLQVEKNPAFVPDQNRFNI